MRVFFTKTFKNHYKKRILPYENLNKQFEERYEIFIENSSDPILKNHALSGKMKGYRSFSVTGDIRVIFYIYQNTVYFVDIGTHNQVY